VVQAFPEAKAAAKKNNIRLILGLEATSSRTFKKEKGLEIYHIILLVKNKTVPQEPLQARLQEPCEFFYKEAPHPPRPAPGAPARAWSSARPA
jgi:hypothetical protein